MAEINIFGYIGEDLFFEGVSLKSVSDQLSQITDKELTVNISSGGGSVNEGKAIYTLLKNSGKNITVKIIGQAYSIASVIAMCGDKVLIGEFADMMVHPAWTYTEGNADDLRATADQLEEISNELFAIYMTKPNLKNNETKLREYFDSEKIISAKDCIELGLADGYLEETKAQIKKFIPLKAVAYYTKSNDMDHKEVKNEITGIKALIAKIMAMISPKVVNASVTAEDGTQIFYEGTLAVGTKCFSDEAMTNALSDGTYVIEGVSYTVSGGEITSESATDSAEVTELKNKVAELTAQIEAANAEKVKIENEKTEELNKVKTEFEAVQNKVADLEKTILGEEGRHTEDPNKGKSKKQIEKEAFFAAFDLTKIKN